jgi:hypothetical protein
MVPDGSRGGWKVWNVDIKCSAKEGEGRCWRGLVEAVVVANRPGMRTPSSLNHNSSSRRRDPTYGRVNIIRCRDGPGAAECCAAAREESARKISHGREMSSL